MTYHAALAGILLTENLYDALCMVTSVPEILPFKNIKTNSQI